MRINEWNLWLILNDLVPSVSSSHKPLCNVKDHEVCTVLSHPVLQQQRLQQVQQRLQAVKLGGFLLSSELHVHVVVFEWWVTSCYGGSPVLTHVYVGTFRWQPGNQPLPQARQSNIQSISNSYFTFNLLKNMQEKGFNCLIYYQEQFQMSDVVQMFEGE